MKFDLNQYFLTQAKEWLFLTLFPQEDINELNRLRANLTPFLEAASDALSAEIEYSEEIEKSIIDKIIQNIPDENSASTTVFLSAQNFNTLHAELDGLLNLR